MVNFCHQWREESAKLLEDPRPREIFDELYAKNGKKEVKNYNY